MINAPRLPGFFTLHEIARLDKTTQQNVSRAVREGLLPVFRIGNVYIVSESDCIAYLGRKKSATKRRRGK